MNILIIWRTKQKKPFEPQSSIGTMYRQVKEVWKIHSSWQESLEDEPITINPNFLINGHKQFIKTAEKEYAYYSSRVNLLVSIYNLANEYELISGCHSGPEEEKKNNDSVETASLEFRNLNAEMRERFNAELYNYNDKLRKASAWYYVAYKAGSILSFGWIMNRLMADIIALKQLPQKDHQALKRIGQSIVKSNFAHTIQHLAILFNIRTDEYEALSNIEILGSQFLEITKFFNESAREQNSANKFLIFLHRIALNIL